MIETLSEHYPVTELCGAFGLHRSRYYDAQERRNRVDTVREQLRAQVVRIHARSRGAAGARTVSAALRASGFAVGRYMAGSLMEEAGVASEQPHNHRYKIAEEESRIAPNHLNRAFAVTKPNQVWCGDVTYIGRLAHNGCTWQLSLICTHVASWVVRCRLIRIQI